MIHAAVLLLALGDIGMANGFAKGNHFKPRFFTGEHGSSYLAHAQTPIGKRVQQRA